MWPSATVIVVTSALSQLLGSGSQRCAGDRHSTATGSMKGSCGFESSRPGVFRFTELKRTTRSEEHTSELQSLMRISYAVFCLKKKKKTTIMKLSHNQ